MTRQEAIECMGSTIPIRYMDNTGIYHDDIATLNQYAHYVYNLNSGYTDASGYLVDGREMLLYSCHISNALNITPQRVTLYIQPEYSIFDSEYIYTVIAANVGNSQTSLAAYNSPSWRWVFAGQNVLFDSVAIANNDVLPQFQAQFYDQWQHSSLHGDKFDFVPAYMTSQATTYGYSIEANFDHFYSDNGYLYFAIGIPYVSNGFYGQSGTVATTTTTASLSVDLGETNGLLGGISSAISGLITKIQNIYNVVSGDEMSITDAVEIVTQPDNIDYEEVLEDADQILEDAPEVIAGGSVYWDIFGRLFAEQVDGRANPAVIFILLIPFAALLSLVSYLFWRG